MARMTPTAGRAGRATAAVTHQHGYRQRLDDGLATVLADVGLLLLAALGITGLACRLGIRQQGRQSTTLRAGREFFIAATLFLQHDFVAIGAAIGRELQSLYPVFHLVDFRQVERPVLDHPGATLRTMAANAVFLLFL